MAGFAPTMWKMAQLANSMILRDRYQGGDCAGNIPEFGEQNLRPPQETQPCGGDYTRCRDQ